MNFRHVKVQIFKIQEQILIIYCLIVMNLSQIISEIILGYIEQEPEKMAVVFLRAFKISSIIFGRICFGFDFLALLVKTDLDPKPHT